MDLSSILGVVVGIGCILVGQILEGGDPRSIMQITAAFIVFGGTIGATLVSFPTNILKYAVIKMKDVFFESKVRHDDLITEIIGFATKARKEGVIILEKEARNASDPLMKTGLEAVADGADPGLVRDLMETEVSQLEEMNAGAAKVWESAGAYAPTIGIVGAVLGLIQVMQNLSDPSALGAGIAVAFVATIYGVGSANLLLIPFSSKLKFKTKSLMLTKEMIIEGILSIQAGESPALIERKLRAFVFEPSSSSKGAKESSAEAA
ncbi:MAG: flagellar motor protein [Cyanobacteriota bacterium]